MQGIPHITIAKHTNLLEQDSEIERTLHQRLREGAESSVQQEVQIEQSEPLIMAEPRRTLSDYEKPQFTWDKFSVQAPTVLTNNFEIKASTIGMIQNSVKFDGLADEDPHAHLSRYLQIYYTFKINSVSDDKIRLRLFPFSLRRAAYR